MLLLTRVAPIQIYPDDCTRAAATPQGAGRGGAAEQRAMDGPCGRSGGCPLRRQALPWCVALYIYNASMQWPCHLPYPLPLTHTHTAVILALDEGKAEAAVKYYGYPDVESKPLSDLSPLRPMPGGQLGPGETTVGFECEVRACCLCGGGKGVRVVTIPSRSPHNPTHEHRRSGSGTGSGTRRWCRGWWRMGTR